MLRWITLVLISQTEFSVYVLLRLWVFLQVSWLKLPFLVLTFKTEVSTLLMSSLSSCTLPGMGSLKKLCFKVIIISRLLIFDTKNKEYCINQGSSIAVHGLNWISPLLSYWRFMQGRQQPGQEKRYFLEQEESTGYLPVFRNIRLEKNKNVTEIKIDYSIHWCTGCHTLSTTTWMSQCWCLTGT